MKYKTSHYPPAVPPGGGGVRPMHKSNTGNVFGNANVEIKLNSINSSKVKGTIQIPVNNNITKSHAGNLNTTPATCFLKTTSIARTLTTFYEELIILRCSRFTVVVVIFILLQKFYLYFANITNLLIVFLR